MQISLPDKYIIIKKRQIRLTGFFLNKADKGKNTFGDSWLCCHLLILCWLHLTLFCSMAVPGSNYSFWLWYADFFPTLFEIAWEFEDLLQAFNAPCILQCCVAFLQRKPRVQFHRWLIYLIWSSAFTDRSSIKHTRDFLFHYFKLFC